MPADRADDQKGLASRLAGIFKSFESDDPAVQEIIEHIDHVQKRVETIRGEVKRGVRKREGRFSL